MSTEEYVMQRHRLTVDEYFRMAEVGILAPDARVELIEGEIIDRAPIGNRHTSVVDHLNHILVRALGDHAIVRVQGSIKLDTYSMPEPDLVVLRRSPDFYRSSGATADHILLVIEVCETSFTYDRNVKVPLFARHRVPEVWLFDLRAECLHVFQEPVGREYRQVATLRDPGVRVPIALPAEARLSLDLGGVL